MSQYNIDLSSVDLIIHNSSRHFIGLKYNYDIDETPMIIFMSDDNEYEKVAKSQGITTVYAPYIAKSLVNNGSSGHEIPISLYKPIAHIFSNYFMVKSKEMSRMLDYSNIGYYHE
jgi:flagellar biosynthesis protein FlhB